MDIEIDVETYIANAMVDLLYADGEYVIHTPAVRKWLTSGGLNYPKNTEYTDTFNFLYKHQGYLVILKEHIKALTMLLEYCKLHNIEYAISAIQDPMDQLIRLDYIRGEVVELLNSVGYQQWFKFNGKFIDKYLGHQDHPTTEEHRDLCNHILLNFN